MGKFKIIFNSKKDKEELYDYIDYELDIIKEKKKSITVKAKNYNKVDNYMETAIFNYNESQGNYIHKSFNYDIEEKE